MDRYDRSIRLLTKEGQDAIKNTHVALIGCGGVGSLVAQQLARLGFVTFTLADPDRVEKSNLPRLAGAYDSDVGRRKVAVIKETIQRANADATVHAICCEIEDQPALLKRADIIVAGVDWLTTRMWLNEQAVRFETPYIDIGAVIDMDGSHAFTEMDAYIQFINPGKNACFECLGRDNADRVRKERLMRQGLAEEGIRRGYLSPSDVDPEPAIITLNGVAASLGAEQVVKHITGFHEPADFLRYDALENGLSNLQTARNTDCLVCGENGLVDRGLRAASNTRL